MLETREAWLKEAIEKLRPYFEDHQLEIPELVRVSCGWPSKGGTKEKNRVLGECWKPEAASDGAPQIFISPTIAEPVKALDVLVHELIHACLPEAKHGKKFKRAATELGLVGEPTSTVAGEDLVKVLTGLVEQLGDYGHAKLEKTAEEKKQQKNRQLKIECPTPDAHDDKAEYILRGAKKTLEKGIPACPLCGETLVQEEGEEE